MRAKAWSLSERRSLGDHAWPLPLMVRTGQMRPRERARCVNGSIALCRLEAVEIGNPCLPACGLGWQFRGHCALVGVLETRPR